MNIDAAKEMHFPPSLGSGYLDEVCLSVVLAENVLIGYPIKEYGPGIWKEKKK